MLFDAPLNPEPDPEARPSPSPPQTQESLPLFADPDPGLETIEPSQEGELPELPELPEDGPELPAVAAESMASADGGLAAEGATVPARLLAGIADLAIHAGVAALLLWGVHSFGIPLALELWPPLGLFLVAFSFLYTAVPLAFWGQTPGMASLGLLTCTPDDQHLTFSQTARRWLAGVVTLALLGLPTLLAFGGRRSLADRVSGSRTVQLPEE
jgi:uncharacterized RDD family membrane protein YckC